MPNYANADSIPQGQLLQWHNGESKLTSTSTPNIFYFIDIGKVHHKSDCTDRTFGKAFHPPGIDDRFFYTASDVYVIPHNEANDDFIKPPFYQILNDESGIPNTVMTVGGSGLFDDQLIGSSNTLGPGIYDIVYDECQDGYLDHEDAVFSNALTINWVKPLPEICKVRCVSANTPTPISLEQVKSTFLKWSLLFEFLYISYKAVNIYQTLKLFANPGEFATKLGNLLDGTKRTIGLFIDIGFDLEDISSIPQVVKNEDGVILGILKQARDVFRGLASDPPDLNYKENTVLKLSPPVIPTTNDPISMTSVGLANEFSNTQSISESLLTALERYQGATIHSDGEWGLIHAKEIRDYSNLLINQINNTNAILQDLQSVVSEDDSFDILPSILKQIQNETRNFGFNIDDVRKLNNAGFNNEQIDSIKAFFIEGNFSLNKTSFVNIINEIIINSDQVVTSLKAISDDANNIVIQLENDPKARLIDIPIVNSGGPYFSEEENPVTFQGNDSKSKIGNNTLYEWDLDTDGIFDDAHGPIVSYTYNHPLHGYVGLRVTNDMGYSNIGYSSITVTEDNKPPVILSYTPNSTLVNSTFGEIQTFTINPFDFENDQIITEWTIDGHFISTGISFNYSPTAEDIGTHIITATVKDTQQFWNEDSKSWVVTAFSLDRDNDGWNDNIDCNDTNPQINPGIKEIFYNDIDDDCNPITLDNNSPPTVHNQSISTIQDTSIPIEFTATDVDNDILNFSLIDNPENGTLSEIIINQFSGIASATYTPNPNFHGTDKLTFIANDGNENSNIGTIDIDTLIATPPVAQSRSVTVDEDTSTNIELNTSGSDGHQLQFELLPVTSIDGKNDATLLGSTTSPQIIDHDSAVTQYTPLPNYQSGTIGMGDDSLIFNVLDPPLTPDQSTQSQGQINIHINPINDAPFSFSKTVRTIENTPIDVFFRATDLENDFLLNNNLNNGIKFSILDLPTHGTLGDLQENVIGFNQDLQLNSTENWITYTPNPGFIGEDNFTILANDGNLTGQQSKITIKVVPQNPEMKSQFTTGDLLVTDGFRLQWLDPDGTANKISDLLTGHSVSGGAIDLQGNVYVPEYNGGIVSKFDNAGNLIGQFGDKINDYGCIESSINNQIICDFWPTAITFDRDGNAYIGGEVFATDQLRDEVDDIKKFDSNGNLVQKYDVDVLSSGIFGLELGADQCTLYYSSWEGANIADPNRDIIKRYDVCENRQLKDFANLFQDPLYDELRFGHQPILDFKLMLDGGMIVAHNAFIHHLDSSGKIIKTYNFAKGVGNWIAVALDSDEKSFWAAAQSHLYKIDIETGEVLQFFDTDPFGSITGTMVYGEPKPSLTEISPIAIDQNIVVNQNVPITLNLTGFDANRDPLTFSIINQPQNGTLGPITQINSTMSQVIYISNNNLDTNTDIITYSATDNTGRDSSNIGSIKISINHRPDATDDFASTLQEVPINIPVLDNDTDSDVINNPFLNDGIHITSVNTTNTLGDVIVNKNNNTVTFVPFSTFSGTDSFTYTISDNNKFTDTANVTVNIQSSNRIPIANPQTISILENTPTNITLTAIDPDSNDTFTFIRGSGPSNGFLNGFNATTGQVQYRPLHNFDGIDTFSFKVFDGKDVSQPGNVTVIVTEDGINDPPVVESERVSTNVSQQISVNVLQNDIDPDGDLLTLTNFTGPFNGTATLNQDQTITYQSSPNFNNSDVLYYRVADPTGDFDIGQLIIDVQGNADTQIVQIPTDRLVTTTRNQPVDIGLEATATIDRPVSFFIIDAPENGTLGDITTLSNLTASIRYTPNSNFQGNDYFTYVAQDANGITSNVGTIQISVNNIPSDNNPPIATDSQATLDEDSSVSIQLTAFDIDLADSLTYSIESQPFNGQILNFDPLTGSLVYQPNPNFNGNDSFLFKAVDQLGLESNIATVHLTVNPVNDPPIANSQQVETNQNTPLQINLTGADPIDNGDTISQFRIVNNPTNGQITGFDQNTGILTYTPNNNFFGNDSFTFKVTDNNGAESIDAATVSIKVNQIVLPNIEPLALDQSVETIENTPTGIQLQGIDIDQGDTIESFRIVNNPINGQISNFNSGTGTLTYTPNSNYTGSDSFTFKVTDNHGLESTNTGLVTINIKPTQEPPPNNAPLPLPSSVCIDSDNSKKKPKGTQGNDELVGTSQRDVITGLGGNDRFNGCSGDDTLNGNSGNDGIAGGPGDDDLHGNEGNDYLQGDSGDDFLFGNEGNDILVGNEGRDRFSCGTGQDKILDFDPQLDIKPSHCEEF
jgi:hypothetical protein